MTAVSSPLKMVHCEPFLRWAGGKRWLAAAGLSRFPKNFSRYIEPFLGSGAIFFALNPQRAILSDSNSELIATYKAIRKNWRKVERLLEAHGSNHSKKYYYEVRSSSPTNGYERAARFIYLNRTCWNALYRVNRKGKFNVPIGTRSRVTSDSDNFQSIARRLRRARLICCDFEKAIRKAHKGDLVYADPPYTINHGLNGFRKYNQHLFDWDDQIRLRDSLTCAMDRGACVCISNAWHSSILELYADKFRMISLDRASLISGKKAGRKIGREYFIMGNGNAVGKRSGAKAV